MKTPEEVHQLFSTRRYVGFLNGTWDFEKQHLIPHSPKHYLGGILPLNLPKVLQTGTLQDLCPNICSWLIDRTNSIEIYANILVAFLFCIILNIKNPERFLFISGYSAAGKSTYLKLLQKVVPHHQQYVTTSETLSSDFGLQELTGIGKHLLILHDLGGTVSSAFVNILRNLVSSGESLNVRRKFEAAALMEFHGVVAAASNKNPFTSQQREGIIDRRMIFVHFVNRVTSSSIRDFDEIFPPEEITILIRFGLQQDPQLILNFLRSVNEHPLVRQNLLDSYKESPKSLHLQNFIFNQLAFSENSWLPIGFPEDGLDEDTLFSAYCRYLLENSVGKADRMSFGSFRQEFLPLLNSVQPSWVVIERRRLFKGKKTTGFLNLQVNSEPEASLRS